jgi:hypothetical protein
MFGKPNRNRFFLFLLPETEAEPQFRFRVISGTAVFYLGQTVDRELQNHFFPLPVLIQVQIFLVVEGTIPIKILYWS